MNKISLLAILITFSATCLAMTWPEEYASRAVQQNINNHSLDCGFSGDKWHSNSDSHRDWAKSVSRKISEGELSLRDAGLSACKLARAYADEAIRHGILNEEYKCGYGGPRWEASRKDHMAWAIDKSIYSMTQETQARAWAIDKCRNKKSSASNVSGDTAVENYEFALEKVKNL